MEQAPIHVAEGKVPQQITENVFIDRFISLPQGADLVLTLPGLEPQPGLACWIDGGFVGVAFNRLIPLGELVAWLHEQRETQRGQAPA